MNESALPTVKEELSRLQQRISEFEQARADRMLSVREAPAIIRASMDLTNALSKLRRKHNR